MAPSILDSNQKKIAWPTTTGAKTEGTNGKYGNSRQPNGIQKIVQYSSGNAKGRVPIPRNAATNQNIQIANSRSSNRRRKRAESNGKALRETSKNIHPTKCITTAGIRRTKALVPPPKSQTSGPGSSRALPNPRASVPQKTKAIWGRRFSVDAGPFGTIGCP